jgi:hypothetical protein
MLAAGTAFTTLGLAGVFKITAHSLGHPGGSALLFYSAPGAGGWPLSTSWAPLVHWLPVCLRQLARRGKHRNDNFTAGIPSAAPAFSCLLNRMLNLWLTEACGASAYAFSTRTLAVTLLGPIAAALGSLTALRLFVSRELWNDDRTLPLGQHWPFYGYGIPVVLFYFAARWLKSSGHTKSATALEGISLGLAISLVSLELRVLIGGG